MRSMFSFLMPARTAEDTRLRQHERNLLQILLGNALTLRDFLERHRSAALMLRHIDQHPQGIASLCRNFQQEHLL